MGLIRLRDFLRTSAELDVVRFYDLAATKPHRANVDPDYTAGVLLAVHPAEARWYIVHAYRFREAAPRTLTLIRDRMAVDDELLGREVPVRVERQPAAAGKFTDEFLRRQFLGRDFDLRKPEGDKRARATPVAVTAEAERFDVVDGAWERDAFFDELDLFPDGAHDDWVDALSGAFRELRNRNFDAAADVDARPDTIDGAGYDIDLTVAFTA